MDEPRPMNESVFSLKRSDWLDSEYSSATLSCVVVDIGASSVPPRWSNSSDVSRSFMPRHMSSWRLACGVLAPTARSFPIASARKLTVTGSGCGAVRPTSRSGPLSTLKAAVE